MSSLCVTHIPSLLGKYLGVEWLSHMVSVCLMFSKTVALLHSVSCGWQLQLLGGSLIFVILVCSTFISHFICKCFDLRHGICLVAYFFNSVVVWKCNHCLSRYQPSLQGFIALTCVLWPSLEGLLLFTGAYRGCSDLVLGRLQSQEGASLSRLWHVGRGRTDRGRQGSDTRKPLPMGQCQVLFLRLAVGLQMIMK
jgi:hypothetical protein